MGSLKRKTGPGENPPAKAIKSNKHSRPFKARSTPSAAAPPSISPTNPRKDPATKPDRRDATAKDTELPDRPLQAISSRLVRDDEPMFPRGGASILTPLEKRDIALRARADVAKEQAADNELGAPKKKSRSNEKKKKKTTMDGKKRKHGATQDTAAEATVKVESLNFKKLAKGSLVLGQVVDIRPLEVVVALPNNLSGYVSIVAVSDQLSTKLQRETQDDEMDQAKDGEDDDDDAGQGADLESLFQIGQYLRAYIISTSAQSPHSKEAKRRIELSVRPADANTGLTRDAIVANTTVMASVVSVEDHGCVMDVGMGADGVTGFLSRKQMGPADKDIGVGAARLCLATKSSTNSTNSKILQLSTLPHRLGNATTSPTDASTINTFLPGTLAEVLITAVTDRGLAAKVLGHLDATADAVHSGSSTGHDLESNYRVGSKIKARVICTFASAPDPKVGVSLLPHVLSLTSPAVRQGGSSSGTDVLAALPLSSYVEACVVRRIQDRMGLYVDVGLDGVLGFVHISRVKDAKIDALYHASGPYQIGSTHRGRVVGYSPVDGLVYLSFEKAVLDQQYLRLEDVPVAAVLDGTVDRIVLGTDGVSGLVVKICEGVVGFATNMHLSDVQLKHPEKKFRPGMKVRARVLSVDPSKGQLRLTLKKTLVNSDAPVIASFDDARVGIQAPGTIFHILPSGARVRFYNNLQAWLPVSQMSEAYIKDPSQHFRIGQVISVHIIEADPEAQKLVVSCKDPSAFGLEKQTAFKQLQIGDVVSAKVSEKNEDEVTVQLVGAGLTALLPTGHLGDRSAKQTRSLWKGIYVGQTLSELMILDKNDERRYLTLTQKPSLIRAQKEGKLVSKLEQAREGSVVQGFVNNIVPGGVLVRLAGHVHGMIPGSIFPDQVRGQENFGLEKWQPISVLIKAIDLDKKRLLLFPPLEDRPNPKAAVLQGNLPALNPVDDDISSLEDVKLGMVTKARIRSIKGTQLNVSLADNIQGRVDVSSVYGSWDQIEDPRKPLQKFRMKDVIAAKVIGVHDARNHRFLPFSHRTSHSVIELSVKPADLVEDGLQEPLTLHTIKVGSEHMAFVNNHGPGCLWVNLTPSVRGRIENRQASNDVSLLQDMNKNFPLGAALRVRVTSVDADNGRLDLSARQDDSLEAITWSTLAQNMVLPATVTKVTDRQVIVQLSDTVACPIHMADLSDNFAEANPLKYHKNDIIRVAVVELDRPNRKLRLSARQSRVLSSTAPVVDPEIRDLTQVHAGDVVRGFVKNVSDKGLFVTLGGSVVAMVKVSNLSDRYLKDWREEFQVDQLVKGRILSVDPVTKQTDLSLKASVTDENYVPLVMFSDMKAGMVVKGKIRKVVDYGAFIVVDGSANVSGLCHRREMADGPVEDATKLYSEGDLVKAKVLDVDAEKKRISFGLKPSILEDEDTEMSDAGAALETSSDDESDAGVHLGGQSGLEMESADEDEDKDDDKDKDELEDADSEEDGGDDAGESGEDTKMDDATNGLATLGSKYDWAADAFDGDTLAGEHDTGKSESASKKERKKRRKAAIEVDRTAELDANGPQTPSDYERLLLGQPDSSALWIAYMAFQMQVSELSKAREVAERAIRTINVREETEKLNVWVAYLNLEVFYGTQTSVDQVFTRACAYCDELEAYERLASIYIQSGKQDAAESLFEAMLKKFGSKVQHVWTNYAHFLHVTAAKPAKARSLLTRATQSLAKHEHLGVLTRIAALEWRSPSGEPERGRTLFEGVLNTYPKKGDLWGQLLDLELGLLRDVPDKKSRDAKSDWDEAVRNVRDVFERRTKVKGLKPKQAEKWFARWADWEEDASGKKGREKVVARAEEWVTKFKARKEREADVVEE